MKKLFSIFAAAVFGFTVLGVSLSQPIYAQADASSAEACQTLSDINPDGASCGAANGQVNKIITAVLNILSVIGGIIAVIMLIISGLKYITSQGDANQISSSKKTLIYAIVGIVVVVFAQIIVRYVTSKV